MGEREWADAEQPDEERQQALRWLNRVWALVWAAVILFTLAGWLVMVNR